MTSTVWAWPDGLRAQAYRVAAPWLAPLYADRARRVLWLGLFSVATSFALAVAAPLWLLALGPLVLGVPHLLADLRYLVFRRALHRSLAFALTAVGLVGVGVGGPPWLGVVAAVPLTWAAQGPLRRRWVVLGGIAVLSMLALRFERAFMLAFLHAHNLLALLLWWWARPRTWCAALIPLSALALSGALLAGLLDSAVSAAGGWQARVAEFDALAGAVAPFGDSMLSAHALLCFAFLQSLHYGVWLRLIPDDCRSRPAPRPFAASWRALVADTGRGWVWAAGVLTVGLLVWAWSDCAGARAQYLRLGAFHGYLELAVAAWALAGAKRPVA